MGLSAPVHVAFPFALLGAAGGACGAYAEGAADERAFAGAAFAWVVPAMVGLLFTSRLGNVGGGPTARWLRPLFVFAAGALGGAVARLATGIHLDSGIALLYGFAGLAVACVLLARVGLLSTVVTWLGRSIFVTPVLLLGGSAVVAMSAPWAALSGFALVLFAAEQVGAARTGSILDRAERRTPWLATGVALAITTAVGGFHTAADRSGPVLFAAVATLLAFTVGWLDVSAYSRVSKLVNAPTRSPLKAGATSGADLVATWLDFGVGTQEWRFQALGGMTSFGIGDPEAARRAIERRVLLDAVGVLFTLAVLVLAIRRTA